MRWLRKAKVIQVSPGDSVEQVVRATIAQFLNPGDVVELSDHLLDGLKLDSDDLTKIVLMLEESFAVKIPRDAYKDVHTMQNLISLFERVRGVTS